MPLVGPGGRSAPIPRPTAPRAAPPPPPRAPGAPPSHTDVTSGGYNFHAVTAYKATPAYHHAVAQVFKAQPAVQQAKIVQGLVRNNAYRSPEFHAIHQAFASLPAAAKGTIASYAPRETSTFISAGKFTPPQLRSFNPIGGLGKLVSGGLGDVAGGIDAIRNATQIGSPGVGNVQTMGGAGTALSKVLTHAPIDVARAAVEHPAVIPKTVKGLADSVVGAVAGSVQLPIRAITEGPGPALSQLGHGLVADYNRRYGPLASGHDQAFINRIKQEGAGPEVFDAFAAAGGLDATAGRALAGVGKVKEALTGEPNFLTRGRPNLLLSGTKERPQQVANTAGRIAAQRLEDAARRKLAARFPAEMKAAEHQVAPIFRTHAIRVTHSGIARRWGRVIQENLQREVRGRPSSAMAAIGRLNGAQRDAVYHAIHGIRMDTAEHLRADLADRRAQILADRANPKSLGNRIPAQYADKVDELKLIDRVTANADKVAGPKMVAFQRGEAERAQRIEALTNLHPATAEARRLRPIGERLGIKHPDVLNAEAGGGLGSFGTDLRQARDRPQQLAAYVKQVRAGMQKEGLPEPGYFRHQPRPEVKFGDFTPGSGGHAMPSDKQSTFALHRAGVADHSIEAYKQGLARSLKRPYQWRMVDEQFRAGALHTPTGGEIRAALGHQKAAHLLTGHELRQVLAHRGEDLSKVAFYNPGRLAERTLSDHGLLPKGKILAEGHDTQINSDLRDTLKQEDVVQAGDKVNEKFLTTPGWKAVPKTALDEIQGGLKGSSRALRGLGKVQGASAGLILSQNPHFLIMNTGAHLLPAIAGTKGAIIPDLLKAPVWWHGLSEADKDRARMFEGGRAGHYNETARLGSQAPHQIAAFGRKLEERGLVQHAKALNPFHAILRGEDLQSNFFRHAVMYHEIKRAAYQDMGHEFGRAVAQWEQIRHVFTLGPEDRMRAIIHDMPKMEELGRTAVNILGDYGRFTARERQFLNNRAVLFYSFLRHVTRTLLYVLPVRHPLAFGLMGELGNLHVEEVKKLLGGQDLPWAYGRMFFGPGNKLSSVDMTSTSPISSPLIDVLSGGVKQLPRLISPALAPILDIAYGQTPQGAKVKQNAYSYLNDLLSLSYPYRQASAARFGLKPQQSDSLPFIHQRPQTYKTAAAQQYQAAKTQARGPLSQYLLGSALGVYPKPDDSRVIAQHMAAKKKGGSSGGGGWGGGTTTGGWGGGSTSSGGWG